MSKYAQIEAPTVATQLKASESKPSSPMEESVEEPKETTSKSKEMTFKSKETTFKSKKQEDDGRHTRPAQASVIRRSGGWR